MPPGKTRSEEHTSELQSLRHLVCRLLLEKKKQEDQGYFIMQMLAPQGASLSYTNNLADQAQSILAKDSDIEGVFSVMGFFFFNDTATTEIYTLSLHDALPI